MRISKAITADGHYVVGHILAIVQVLSMLYVMVARPNMKISSIDKYTRLRYLPLMLAAKAHLRSITYHTMRGSRRGGGRGSGPPPPEKSQKYRVS